MSKDLELAGKWKIQAHGRTLHLRKRALEKRSHVIMKGLIWALYVEQFPDLKVEVPIGHRYKPDVVSLGSDGRPVFWGEAGAVGKKKIAHLCRKFKATHLTFAKWGKSSKHIVSHFAKCAEPVKREAVVELLFFPEDSRERFVDEAGNVNIQLDQLERFVWE